MDRFSRGDGSRAPGVRATREFSSQIVLLSTQDADSEMVLVLRGDLTGSALDVMGYALDAVRGYRGGTVFVDVSELNDWSLVAQAMILATARGAARRGQQVILVGPSDELRAASRGLDIFGRVQTRPGAPTE